MEWRNDENIRGRFVTEENLLVGEGGVTLRWTSTSLRGGRNTPSGFMLEPDGPVGSYADLSLFY